MATGFSYEEHKEDIVVHNNLPLTIVVQFQGSIPAPCKVVVQVESTAVALLALPARLGK